MLSTEIPGLKGGTWTESQSTPNSTTRSETLARSLERGAPGLWTPANSTIMKVLAGWRGCHLSPCHRHVVPPLSRGKTQVYHHQHHRPHHHPAPPAFSAPPSPEAAAAPRRSQPDGAHTNRDGPCGQQLVTAKQPPRCDHEGREPMDAPGRLVRQPSIFSVTATPERCRIPHSAFRIPHSAFRRRHPALPAGPHHDCQHLVSLAASTCSDGPRGKAETSTRG